MVRCGFAIADPPKMCVSEFILFYAKCVDSLFTFLFTCCSSVYKIFPAIRLTLFANFMF